MITLVWFYISACIYYKDWTGASIIMKNSFRQIVSHIDTLNVSIIMEYGTK